MFKLLATILVVCGTSGMGISLWLEQKQRIIQLKSMQKIMEMMKNEIQYSHSSFPEMTRNIEGRVDKPFQKFFQIMNANFKKNEGKSFLTVWKEGKQELDEIACLKKRDKELFLEFPSERGYENGEMQEREMERKLLQIQDVIRKAEKNVEENQKVFVCVGVMSGLLCSLIFW